MFFMQISSSMGDRATALHASKVELRTPHLDFLKMLRNGRSEFLPIYIYHINR